MRAPPASIKVRALQWLAQREHSPAELRGKLLRLLQAKPRVRSGARRGGDGDGGGADADADADAGGDAVAAVAAAAAAAAAAIAEPVAAINMHRQVDDLLEWLTVRGYLSAGRFVESRVHVRQSRYGNLRIQQELRHHGLALDADAGQALKATELQRATAVWRKKYAAPAQDVAQRVRQMRFLSGRGFSPEVIRQVLRTAGADSSGAMAEDDRDGLDGCDAAH